MHAPAALRQPTGHDAAVQTHFPAALHVWPGPQLAQAAPPAPHDALDSPPSGSHAPAAVQQPVHAAPPHEQAPLEQASPALHVAQAIPPMPH